MSVGDITIRIEVEGGTAKTATVLSAVRVNAMAWMNRSRGDADNPNLTDATYSVHIANSAANGIIHAAKKQ
ncbi:uncharacterized protein METZ01_LOCUS381755, partial [marine metagenome]